MVIIEIIFNGSATSHPTGGGDVHAVQEQLAPADVYKLPSEGLRGVPKEVILYQYDVCPFCCKVKAVLDYYRVRCLITIVTKHFMVPCMRPHAELIVVARWAQIPYRCVEVGPLMKTELKWSAYKKVQCASTNMRRVPVYVYVTLKDADASMTMCMLCTE
jgi:microsomal prostaglandin-E synthase 2